MPNAQCLMQDIGELEEYVEQSAVIMIFVSNPTLPPSPNPNP